MRVVRGGVWLLLLAVGCEKGSTGGPVAADQCTKPGEQCKLPNGPLGVCNIEPCRSGEAGPCFKCQSQH